VSDTFPHELSEEEAGSSALSLDTDAMLAELHSIVGEDVEPADEPSADGEAEEPEEAPAEEVPPAPTSVVPPGYVEFQGRHWPVEEVQAMLALNQRMKESPELAQRVGQALTPAPETATLPEWIDPSDTTAVKLWEHQQRIDAEQRRIAAQAEARAADDRRTQVVDGFKDAVSEIRSRYPQLTDEQLYRAGDIAGRSGIFDGLERAEGSLRAGFVKGLDMVLWSTPELRSAVSGETATTVPANAKDRKMKQAALTPGGAPASKATQPVERPKTREQLMEAMLNDVRSSVAE